VVEELAGPAARIRHRGGVCRVRFAGSGSLGLESSRYCPEFGVSRERQALCFQSAGTRLAFGFCIADGPDDIGYDLASGANRSGETYPW
jgi:hypothetical protein